MKKIAIIVAGGMGKRFGEDLPKQFFILKNKPILYYSLKVFSQLPDCEIIVVLPADYIDYWKELCINYSISISHKIVTGGETRYYSVKNGLYELKNTLKNKEISDSVVAIHDGARPFISVEFVNRLYIKASTLGNAIPCIPISESIRYVEGDINKSVDRNNYYIVQTPQCFRLDLLLKAYTESKSDNFTDDATVLESIGEKINITEGEFNNIKITKKSDLLYLSGFNL